MRMINPSFELHAMNDDVKKEHIGYTLTHLQCWTEVIHIASISIIIPKQIWFSYADVKRETSYVILNVVKRKGR